MPLTVIPTIRPRVRIESTPRLAPSAAPNDPPLLGENESEGDAEEAEAAEEESSEDDEGGRTSTHEPAPPRNVRMWRAPAHDIADYLESYPAFHTGRS